MMRMGIFCMRRWRGWVNKNDVGGLDAYLEKCSDRNEAVTMAYKSGGYAMAQIEEYFSVHDSIL